MSTAYDAATWDTVTRYVNDGIQPVLRETYDQKRQGSGLPNSQQASFSTRFMYSYPGGPIFYADSDGTLDVQVPDRYGQPWVNGDSHRLCECQDGACVPESVAGGFVLAGGRPAAVVYRHASTSRIQSGRAG